MVSKEPKYKYEAFAYIGDMKRFVLENKRLSYSISLGRIESDSAYVYSAKEQAKRELAETIMNMLDQQLHYEPDGTTIASFSVHVLTDAEREKLLAERESLLAERESLLGEIKAWGKGYNTFEDKLFVVKNMNFIQRLMFFMFKIIPKGDR